MMSAGYARHRLAALDESVAGDAHHRRRSNRVVRWLGLGAAVLASLLIMGPLLVVAGAAGWVLLVRSRPIVQARRDAVAATAVLPDALELFVLIVHTGLTPRQAIEVLAIRAPIAVRHGFAAAVHRLDRGDALADALHALPDALGASTLGLVDLIGSADRYGLPLAPVLGQLADQARADRRRAADASARSLPVKLAFPLVVCTLPSFVLLAIVPAVMAALSSLQDTSW